MASSGGGRAVQIVVWAVVAILTSGVFLKMGGSAYALVTGRDEIAQRFASGAPATVGMDTFKSNAAPDERPIYVRADASGAARCATTDPDVTLSQRSGSDVTVDGTSWRQIYVLKAGRGGDHRITCRAGKGAEFGVGRDEYWDGPLLFGLAILVLIAAFVAWENLRRKLNPAYAAAQAEKEAARRAEAERLRADVEEAEAKLEQAEAALRETQREARQVRDDDADRQRKGPP